MANCFPPFCGARSICFRAETDVALKDRSHKTLASGLASYVSRSMRRAWT